MVAGGLAAFTVGHLISGTCTSSNAEYAKFPAGAMEPGFVPTFGNSVSGGQIVSPHPALPFCESEAHLSLW